VPAPFTFPVRVYYEDTDAAGVVYYANYLRYLERARSEWLGTLGFPVAELARERELVFVVRRIEVEFRAPARLADALDVTASIEALRQASLSLVQDVRRGDAILVAARVELACVAGADFRPVRMPGDLRARLAACVQGEP
jgi:acyl-CoA thioester hydrolase